MTNKVLKGEYEGKNVVRMGNKVYVANGFKRIYIDSENVKAYEKQDEDAGKRSVTGVIMLGIFAKKHRRILVKIEWRDGGKSLIECDEKIFKAITTQCFE